MRAGVLAMLMAGGTGCSFHPGGTRATADARDIDGPAIDAPDAMADAMADATPDTMMDAALCTLWSPAPKHFMPCAIAAPMMGGLVLTSASSPYKLDTTTGALTDKNNATVMVATGTLTQTSGPDALIVSVESLTVEASASLSITGTKPAVIASFGAISIAGTLDVTSRNGGSAGAGSVAANTCGGTAGTVGANEVDTGGGSGGGGGGAFRGGGGMGGPGDGQNAGGGGGAALGAFPTVVRGGCPGARSGTAGPSAGDPTAFSAGGAGGGALQLTARTTITFTGSGRVLAGGAGGSGSIFNAAAGGGGGGSGGYLGLQASTVTLAGTTILAANGGAGGSSGQFSGMGFPGQDGQAGTTAAVGGADSGGSPPCAPDGANGAAGATLDGPGATQMAVSCGGGGGGGGVGFIGVFTPASGFMQNSATISPAIQANPF